MASWFQGGLTENLSQLTGQISNFTKEVLTDGTEEIDDPATQLKISEKRILELESLCSSQRQEYERLKHAYEENAEKLESSELQISAQSNEYRGIIHQKEEEIQRLQHSEHELYEKLSRVSQHASSRSGSDPFEAEDSLFSTSPNFESSFQNLAPSNFSVEARSNHGRPIATPGESDVRQLQQQILSLEAEVRSLRDSQQAELVALQDAHSHKLSQLKKRHKDEVKALRHELQGQEAGQVPASISSDLQKELKAVKESLTNSEAQRNEIEKTNAKLQAELEKLKQQGTEKSSSDNAPAGGEDGDGDVQARMLELENQLTERTAERDGLVESLEELDQQNSEALQQIIADRDKLKAHNKAMQSELEHVKQTTANSQDGAEGSSDKLEIEELRAKVATLKEAAKQHTVTLTQLEDMKIQVSKVTELENQCTELRNKCADLEKQCRAKDEELENVTTRMKNLEGVEEQFEAQTKDLVALRRKYDELFDNEVKYVSRIKELETQLEELESEVESDEKRVKDLEKVEIESIAHTSELVDSLRNQIYQLEQKKKAWGDGQRIKEMEAAEEQYTEQTTEIIDSLKNQVYQLEQEKKTWENGHRVAELESAETQYTAQTSEVVDTLRNKVFQLEEEKKQWEDCQRVAELESAEAQYTAQTSEVVDDLRNKVFKLEEEKKQWGEKQTNLAEAEKRITSLEEEISNLEEANIKLEAELTDTQEQIETRQTGDQDIQLKEQRLKQAQAELETAQNANDKLQESLATVQTEKADLLGKLTAMNSEGDERKSMVETLTSQLQEAETVRNELRAQRSSLESQISSLKAEAEKAGRQVQQLQESYQHLQDENNSKCEEIQKLQSSDSEAHSQHEEWLKEKDALKEQVASLEGEKEELSAQCDELQQTLLNMKTAQEQKFQSERVELTTRIDSLTSQRESLERELSSTEQKLREQIKQQENYITELTQARDLDTSGIEAEHDRLMKVARDKDTEIRELRSALELKQNEHDYTKEMLQSSIDSQKGVNDLLAEKDEEIASFTEANNNLSQENDAQNSTLKGLEAELTRLKDIEQQHASLLEEHRNANAEVDNLRKRVKELESKEETDKVESATLDIITDLESEVTNLRSLLGAAENKVSEQESKLNSLSRDMNEKEAELSSSIREKSSAQDLMQIHTQSMTEMESNVTNLNASLAQKNELIEHQEKAIEALKGEINTLKDKLGASNETKNNKDLQNVVNSDESDKNLVITATENGDYVNGEADSIQIENMQRMVTEQSTELDTLKERNRELTQLLASRGSAGALGDVQRLDAEMSALRLEKEQMMQVLNDKTRECSQLKGEVHKLMSVVSAEKTALSKLQQDNAELREGREGGAREKEDMQKEALRKLSRIIRDKELEIESLNMKNQTLLQVLQESSSEGPQISSIMQERDNLQKQIALFQSDREQIINALSSKHQECMLYHSEIQRLNGLISTDSGRSDTLQQQYDAIVKQYEDKQQALVTAQNELITLKQQTTGLKNDLAEVRLKCAESDGKIRKYDKEVQALREQLKVGSGTSKENASIQKVDATLVQSGVPSENSTGEKLGHSDSNSSLSQSQSQEALYSNNCDHEKDIESLRSIVLTHEQRHMETDRMLAQKDSEILKLNKQISERDTTLDEKSKQFSELSHRFHKTEQMLRTRDSEIGAIRKQNDTMSFQIKGFETDLADLRAERDQYMSRANALEQQVDMQKEANNKLSMALKDHAFELNALKEKNNRLTRMMQEKNTEGEEKGEMDRLMKETETLQHQAKVFKIDADQFAMALQQQQEENRELKTQLMKVSEKEAKCSREVDRLRTHLVQVEDGYTRELLEAEEREKDLRMRLASAEERALSASTSVDRANIHASKQLESLHQQLSAVSEQRDQLGQQLAAAQEQAAQYAAESNNLHIVLEQFQQEREQQQAAEVEHYLREASVLKQQNKALKSELHQVQIQLGETTEALEAASRLSEQLDRKEQMVSALREEVQTREHQLSQAEANISRLSASNSAKVDKALARNLILGYFHTPANKKEEVLKVISRALDFQGEELQQLEGEAAGGWFKGLFKKVVSTQTMPSTPPKPSALDKSFSEALVKFMERESSPGPAMKLPAEQMALASQARSQQSLAAAHSAAFNPFSTPVSQVNTPFSSAVSSGGLFAGSRDRATPLSFLGEGTQAPYPLTIPGSTAGTQTSHHHPFSAPPDGTSAQAGSHVTQGTSGAAHTSHLLMPAPPVTPNLPMFSMATGSDSGRELHDQPPGGEHRRSGSQNSSAILKDILQQ